MKFEKLGNIADIIAGQSPPSSTYNSEGKGLPFFQGKADFGEKYPSVRFWCTEPTKISFPQDILISMRAPVGPVNINVVESCIGRGLSAIRVKKNVSRDYIYYWLKLNQHIISAKESGSTFKAITQKVLNEIFVPFPSYNDQIHIAHILSKAENLIAQRKECIRLLDEFLKSTFFENFGDPLSNSNKWEIFKIRNCAKVITGTTPPSSKDGMFGGEIPFITPSDLESDGLNKRFVTKEGAENSRTAREGATFVCCIGATIGKVNRAKVLSAFNQQLNAIEWNNDFQDLFGERLMRYMKPRIIAKGRGSTTLPILNKGDFENIEIIKPPIELQTQFARIVEKTEALKAQYQQSLQELENLYGSLSQRAFRGELSFKNERN